MGNSDHGTTYMRVGWDDGELQPWHLYVHSIESRLIRRVIYEPRTQGGTLSASTLLEVVKHLWCGMKGVC